MSILKYYFLILSLLSVQFVFAASDDDYLKQLEVEAESDVETVESEDFIESQQSETSSDGTSLEAPSTDTELIFDKKELITDKKSFENALEKAYKESYGLYLELSDEQKRLIYDDFTQTKRLYNSSVKIISVYLSSH